MVIMSVSSVEMMRLSVVTKRLGEIFAMLLTDEGLLFLPFKFTITSAELGDDILSLALCEPSMFLGV